MSKDGPAQSGNFPKVESPQQSADAEELPAEKTEELADLDITEILVVRPDVLVADLDPVQALTDLATRRWIRALPYNLERLLGPPN